MRLFIASRLGSESQRFLAAETRRLVLSSAGLLRAVPEGSEHLTHVFLGERGQTLDQLRGALEPITRQPGLEISIGGTHVFSRRKRPRLVCLDVLEGGDQLEALGEAIRHSLQPLLPDLGEYRIKRPHVTLARFSRRARRPDAIAVEGVLADSDLAEWTARESIASIELIRSELDHRGARYETLDTLPLGPAPD